MQRMRKICVAGLFLVVLGFGGCAEIADENGKAGSSVSEDERFEAYTREVFCSEVSANAVSLHYTLKYPQEYGIESAPAVYGTVVTDEQAVKAGVENMEKALITFEKNKLSVENQITYDVLQSYLDSAERSAEYLWYDEPLGTVSGVQTQLPVVLSEYRFYEKEEEGLCGLPQGQEYYQVLVDQSVGTKESIVQLEELTRRQMEDDITAMEGVLGAKVEEAKESAADMKQGTAELILKKLSDGIEKAFPETPDTTLEVKYVPKEMEEHLSPAFYMIPAIDNSRENVIYINQGQMRDDLSLFTTLAHEGYPGHLYQTIFYESTDPDPVRSIFNFGGYVEGWATYAEMCSYYLTPLPKEQATILQKNGSVILALYALADMGIHYDGWSRIDTTAFFAKYGISDAETIQKIYDLILGSPGNYLKYYIGYVKFLELKKCWAEKMGEDFSQKEFHRAVLSVGPAPFDVVETYMWNYAQ